MTNVLITCSCSYGQNAPLPPFGTAAMVALHSKSLFTVGFSSLTISRRSWSIQSCCTRGDNHIGRGRMKTRTALHPLLLLDCTAPEFISDDKEQAPSDFFPSASQIEAYAANYRSRSRVAAVGGVYLQDWTRSTLGYKSPRSSAFRSYILDKLSVSLVLAPTCGHQ